MTSGMNRTLITKRSWRMSHNYLGIHSLMRCYWTPAWLLAKILMRGSRDIEELRKANLQSSMEIGIHRSSFSFSSIDVCKELGSWYATRRMGPHISPASRARLHVCCGSGISSHMLCCSIYRCRSHCLASTNTPKCPRSMGVSLKSLPCCPIRSTLGAKSCIPPDNSSAENDWKHVSDMDKHRKQMLY